MALCNPFLNHMCAALISFMVGDFWSENFQLIMCAMMSSVPVSVDFIKTEERIFPVRFLSKMTKIPLRA